VPISPYPSRLMPPDPGAADCDEYHKTGWKA